MTIDDLAVRIASAADTLAGMRAELSAHEPVWDPAGKGAADLSLMLGNAWQHHTHLVAGLSGSLARLSTSVRTAAGDYRATDEEAM